MLKLDAVNYMLTAVGEAPVNSIATVDLTQDAAIAVSILDMQVRQLLSQRWHFNSDENVTLTRGVDNTITVSSSILKFEIDTTEHNKKVAIRGGLLYWVDSEETDKTIFDEDIQGTATYLLDFEDIPEQPQHYIVSRATRVFAERTLGVSDLSRSLAVEEQQAFEAFYQSEVDSHGENYLNDSLSAYSTYRYI